MITLDEIYLESTHLNKIHTALHDCFFNQIHYKRVKHLLDAELARILTANLMFAHELYYQDLTDIRNNDVKLYDQSKMQNDRLKTQMISDYRRIVRNFANAIQNHKALLIEVMKKKEFEA
jgi:hypothetical protein